MKPPHLSDTETRFHTLTQRSRSTRHDLAVTIGCWGDYQALARFHYIAGKPATHVHVLCIQDPIDKQLVGVLVISMPTLDGSWRQLAWPNRYRSRDRAAAARRINRELRTISRVIVDPRYRGMGLARALVEAYLANPLTQATEAIAAMGAVSPFFKAAGMTEYRLPVKPANARLLDALHACKVSPASLNRPACAQSVLESTLIARELRHWSKSRKDTRNIDDIDRILPFAARALLGEPRAYAHTHVPSQDK